MHFILIPVPMPHCSVHSTNKNRRSRFRRATCKCESCDCTLNAHVERVNDPFSMEVIEPRQRLLTNAEVAQLVKEVQSNRTLDKKDNANKHLPNIGPLMTVLYETAKYLKDGAADGQTAQHLQAFAEATRHLKLTRAEFIQICNLRPTTPVEVQLLVEECEERLSETKVEELISLVCAHLPDPKILDPSSQTDGMKLDNSDATMKTEPPTDDT